MSASGRRCISFSGLTPHTLAPGCVSASTAVDGMQCTALPRRAQSEEEAMLPPSSLSARSEVHKAYSPLYCSLLIQLWLLDHKDPRSNCNDYP